MSDAPLTTDQLTEDDVVAVVREHLASDRWSIDQSLTTVQRGVDIIATRDGVALNVEAKGATSSKEGTNRFRKTFSRGQVFDHVAKAVLTTLAVVGRGDGTRAALALPGNANHREFVGRIASVLESVGVTTFFVSAPTSVRVEGASLD